MNNKKFQHEFWSVKSILKINKQNIYDTRSQDSSYTLERCKGSSLQGDKTFGVLEMSCFLIWMPVTQVYSAYENSRSAYKFTYFSECTSYVIIKVC
jgi:hypothetical protein